MCRGVSHTPSMAGKLHIKRRWCVRCHHFVFAHVRAYAICPYTCSIEFWADNIMTKPPKRSWRRWLGLHKTLKTVATILTRVTQNPQNGCDDADSGHTKPSKRLRRCWLGSHKTLETVATTELCSHSLVNATATVKMLHRSLHRC